MMKLFSLLADAFLCKLAHFVFLYTSEFSLLQVMTPTSTYLIDRFVFYFSVHFLYHYITFVKINLGYRTFVTSLRIYSYWWFCCAFCGMAYICFWHLTCHNCIKSVNRWYHQTLPRASHCLCWLAFFPTSSLQVSNRHTPGNIKHNVQENWNSSDQTTFFLCSVVYFWCSYANCECLRWWTKASMDNLTGVW